MHFSTLYKFCPVCGSAHFIQNNEKSKQCKACDFVLYINAAAAVASFIVNDQGDLLVCRRAKDPAKGTLDLAGGFVDAEETAEEAIKREIAEELNAEVIGSKYLFSLPNNYEYSGLTIPTLDMFFSCELKDNNNLKASDDVEECFFVPVSKINPKDFGLNSIRKAVALFLNNTKH